MTTSAALLLSPAAKATTVTFNFNTLANGAGDSSVQSYMNGVLTGTGGTVTVAGAQASNAYTGDGHVVGPTVNGVVKSNTLATLGGTFIDNVSTSSEIDMTITSSSPKHHQHRYPSRARCYFSRRGSLVCQA